jgi:REP element-mobilizing transposase RayT
MPDHVHLLIELSSLDKYSDFLRDIKASSSLWIHKTYSDLANFAWQEGFGSFSVSTPRSALGLPACRFTRGFPLFIATAI